MKFISVYTEFKNYYININGNRHKSSHIIQTLKTEKVCNVVCVISLKPFSAKITSNGTVTIIQHKLSLFIGIKVFIESGEGSSI